MLKKLGDLSGMTDEEVSGVDLSQYDLSEMRPFDFEVQPMDATVNVRMPKEVLEIERITSKKLGMTQQRFIRTAIGQALKRAGVAD